MNDSSGADKSDVQMNTCDLCHRQFHAGNVIKFQEKTICAECKPVFFQKLLEGVGEFPAEADGPGLVVRELCDLARGIVSFRRNATLIYPKFCPITEGKSAWRLRIPARAGKGVFVCKLSRLGYLLVLLSHMGSCMGVIICSTVATIMLWTGIGKVRHVLFSGVDEMFFWGGSVLATPLFFVLIYCVLKLVIKRFPSLCGVSVESVNRRAVIVQFSNLHYADRIYSLNSSSHDVE